MNHPCSFFARTGIVVAAMVLSDTAGAATMTATISATPVKPLTISKVQDLDLGSITLGPGTWGDATIALARTGTFSCTDPNTVCAGVPAVAKYNVQGSNQQTVQITAPNVTLVNQNDPTQTLTLVTDAPGSVLLTNSGFPGVTFSIGGSVTVAPTTAAGTYVGNFNVTVDY